MASIGGLDLGYGSQTQIVRTNVLCISTQSPGINSAAAANHIHNQMKEGMKGSLLEPDFTYFYELDAPGQSGYTEAAHAAIFDQDPDNTGTANTTSVSTGGLLRDISQVPLVTGSAHADATQTAPAFGADTVAHDIGDISGNLMLQGVLSVSGVVLTDETAATTAGLFVDSNDSDASPAVADANEVGGLMAGVIGNAAMKAQYDNMFAATASGKNRGNLTAGAGISTGARLGPCTMDLEAALTQMETVTDTGAVVSTLNTSHLAATLLGPEAIVSVINNDASIISVLSLAKVC
jgi:hypothetical protein